MSTVASIAAPTAAASTSSKNSLNSIQVSDFLKIMVQELQQQDPFEPLSSKELMGQIGQIRDIQSSMELTDVLKDLAASQTNLAQMQESLTLNQQLASGGTLLGKLVQGMGSDGQPTEGLVMSVRVKDDKVHLELDTGERIVLDDVIGVHNDAGESLVGKLVKGPTVNGQTIQGLVMSAGVKDDKVYLELDTGQVLPLDEVSKVYRASIGPLLGKWVRGATGDGTPVEGRVTSAGLDKDAIYLKLHTGQTLLLDSVVEVNNDPGNSEQ